MTTTAELVRQVCIGIKARFDGYGILQTVVEVMPYADFTFIER